MRQIAHLFASCMVSLFLFLGCGIGAIADPSLSGSINLQRIQNIVINDEWMGLSDVGPIKKHYELRVAGNQIVGRAIFSLGGGPMLKTREEAIAIPQLASEDFFRILGASPYQKGKYQKKIEHTDDYPSRKILLGGDGTIDFYSDSQGEFATPWGLTWKNEDYTIDAKNPMEALLKIKPYLKEDVFESFLAEVRKSKFSR